MAAHAQAATGGNLGFLGVPLLLALQGERAAGPLGMAMVAEVGLLMPLGIVLMSVRREGASRGLARELALATVANPIVVAVGAGAVLGLTGARLPAPFDRFLSFVGASAGPTVLYPAVAWAFLRASGLPPPWVAAGVLIAALPTAAYVFVFAQRHDAVPERISAEILLSTVAGALTFPLVAWLVAP
jgi:predicted permease